MGAPVQPVEGSCGRCKQPRALFRYKPLHDCIKAAGSVGLIDAAALIATIEEQGDRWCISQIDRHPRLLCVPCHDREVADEEHHIKEYEL